MTRVFVDPDLCAGTANCTLIAPTAFRLDDKSLIATVLEDAGSTDLNVLLDAAYECPTGAIVVELGDVQPGS